MSVVSLRQAFSSSSSAWRSYCTKAVSVMDRVHSLPDFSHPPVFSLPKPASDVFQKSKPISHYIGPNPFKATFRQGRISDCYVLSSLDAIQHHPRGPQILDNIRVTKDSMPACSFNSTYQVRFPSGAQVQLHEMEIGEIQDSYVPVRGPKGIKMLELAYAKMIAPFRNVDPKFNAMPFPNNGHGHDFQLLDGGLPSEAMSNMLIGSNKAKFTRCYPDSQKLEKMVKHIAYDPDHDYILCALSQDEGEMQRVMNVPPRPDGIERKIKAFTPMHSYSIRAIKPDAVVVADPHNTAEKVETLTPEEFSKVFTCLDGLRFEKQPASFIS